MFISRSTGINQFINYVLIQNQKNILFIPIGYHTLQNSITIGTVVSLKLISILRFIILFLYTNTFIIKSYYNQISISSMVFIKLTPQLWTLSGLANLTPDNRITQIDGNRYISYKHFKEAAAKTDAHLHSLVQRQNVISNIDMKKIRKQAEKTPQEKRFAEQIRNRHQMRFANKYNKQTNYYFEEKKDQSIKDLSKSISFGLTFIFSFFMAGLTGYYFGTYFLGFDNVKSLMLSVGFIIFTIVVETTLYIIKQNREDANQRKKRKKISNPKPMTTRLTHVPFQNKKKKQ